MNNGLIGYTSFESEVPPDLFMGLPLAGLIVYIYIYQHLDSPRSDHKHLDIRAIMAQVAVGLASVADHFEWSWSSLTAC
jgi:hypothetical protein